MTTRSMTGYGAASVEAAGIPYRVEVRALNHKGLDLKLRLPRELIALEPEMGAVVRSHVQRGSVEVFVRPEDAGASSVRAIIDKTLAASVVEGLRRLRAELKLEGDVTLDALVSLEGLIRIEEGGPALETVRGPLLAALAVACEQLASMRAAEGERLALDLRGRASTLIALTESLEGEAELGRLDARQRLTERWGELTAGLDGGPADRRMEQELALIADRADITEEIVRLRAHAHEAVTLLGLVDGEPVGRRLAFLAQEMQRETATIAAKSGRLSVTRLCIDARCEVERIREQVMNLE